VAQAQIRRVIDAMEKVLKEVQSRKAGWRPATCYSLCFFESQLGERDQMAMNDGEIAIVKGMLARGDRQHDIAAYFGLTADASARSAPDKPAAASRRHQRKICRLPVPIWPVDQPCARATRSPHCAISSKRQSTISTCTKSRRIETCQDV
jgi:hypothetical protein